MLKQKISTQSLRGSTANFVRHYLNPGDDIALPWQGVPDDCAFYTFKYSNQFSYDFDVIKFQGTWAIPCYGVGNAFTAGATSFYDWKQSGSVYAEVTITGDHIASLTNILFVRFPFPELPGGILLSWVNASDNDCPHFRVKYDADYVAEDTIARLVLFPIHDPNWKPSRIHWKNVYAVPGALTNKSFPTASGVAGDTILGMAENFTSYRVCGASMTVENTTASLYRDGSIYATNICCPYDVLKGDGLPHDLQRYVNDFPIDVTSLTSFQPYHVFKASEGAYVVLRHSGDNFDYKNVRQYTIRNNVSALFDSGNSWYYNVGPIFSGESTIQTQYSPSGFLNLTNDKFLNIYYVGGSASGSTSEKPDYTWHFDTTEPVNWTTGVVIPTVSDWNRATFTIKFNTYVECTCGTKSVFKPSITRSAPYDGEAFRVIRDFYLDHDGIYPASWNSNGKLNNIINRLKSTGTISYLYTPRPGPTRKQIAARKAIFDKLREIQGHAADRNVTPEDEDFIKQAIANHYIQSWEKYLASFKQNPPKKNQNKKPAGRKPQQNKSK